MQRLGNGFWTEVAAVIALLSMPISAIAQSPLKGTPATPASGGLMAGFSTQSQGPVDIAADKLTYDSANCASIATGSVEMLQGTSRLRAEVAHAFSKHKPATGPDQSVCGPIERIEVDGDVFYVTPDETARGDHAVYDADQSLIVMTGNVVLVQAKRNVVRGDRLTIHTLTHLAEMVSTAQGRGTPGRVRAVLYPSAGQGVPSGPTGTH
jgi:lipopolysaccharide export system protein LptA